MTNTPEREAMTLEQVRDEMEACYFPFGDPSTSNADIRAWIVAIDAYLARSAEPIYQELQPNGLWKDINESWYNTDTMGGPLVKPQKRKLFTAPPTPQASAPPAQQGEMDAGDGDG